MAEILGDSTAVAVIVGVVGGGGVLGFLTTLLKWKPERTNVLVDAAQGAVIVQSGVIEDLNDRLGQLREQAEEQTRQIEQLQREVHQLTDSLRSAVHDAEKYKRERDAALRRLEIIGP